MKGRQNMKSLVNIHQMASILGLPVSWLYRRTCEGKMPHYKLGKYVRFDPDEVMSFVKKIETA
jgi:excisionase family DNA binding protein